MTDGTPGWFRDPSDASVARWHDGDKWTEHTLVIADQAPGVEPAPPVINPPTTSFAEPSPDFHIPRGGSARIGGLPLWAKIAAPIAVVLLVLLGVKLASGGDDKKDDKTATADTTPADLDKALDAARAAGLPEAVSDARARAFIARICSAATNDSTVDQLGTDLGQLPATTGSEIRKDVGALGEGAAVRCPGNIGANPDLIDNLQDKAVTAFSTTTTAPTLVTGGVDGGVDAGVADAGTDSGTGTTVKGGKTTTTVKGGKKVTTTTVKPTTTTTLVGVLPNAKCSSAGAKARNKFNGDPLTCARKCNPAGGTSTSGGLYWSSGSGTCPPPSTLPTTPATTPTTASPSTTAIGDNP